MKLDHSEFSQLLEYIDTSPTLTEGEREQFKITNPGLYNTSYFAKGKHNVTHYKRQDNRLTQFLQKLTGRKVQDMTALHTITYYPGPGNKPHVDNSDKTIVIILESDCKGGEFILNGIEQDEFYTARDYTIYNGGLEEHSVNPITEGTRKVLVAWYKETHLF
jgi:hypothetical protein